MRHVGDPPAGVHPRPRPPARPPCCAGCWSPWPSGRRCCPASPSAPTSTSTRCCVRCTARPSRAPRSAIRRSRTRRSCGVGLSPLAVTISTDNAAPVLAGVRLRAGKAGSSRGATSMVTEAINTAIEAGAQPGDILVRGDSAYCGGKIIAAVVKAGARFSFAIAHNSAVDAAIAPSPTTRSCRCSTPARSKTPTPAS